MPRPGYTCEVFRADAVEVVSGANAGDRLDAVDLAVVGDLYRLERHSTPRALGLELGPPLRVANEAGSDLAGQRVEQTGRLILMAADGDTVELEVLRIGAQLWALPLSPLRAQVDYTLIRTEPAGAGLRLADLACAAFLRGTRITRADGTLVAIEQLAPGDMILTRDNGAQPLRWTGAAALRARGNLAPVIFAPGVLGNAAALGVGPHHRIFVYHRGDARPELLVPARFLVDGASVTRHACAFAEYHSLVFDAHEIIYAEGVPVESLLVTDATVGRLPATMADDLQRRFPGLRQRGHFAREPDAQAVCGLKLQGTLGKAR